MNAPTPATRFIGTRRNAAVLYVGSGLAVFGWFGGAVPWWLGLMALCFIGTVRKAVQDVSRYDAWAAEWRAMGGPVTASPRPAKPSFRMRHKNTPPWVCVTLAALSLVVLSVLIASPDINKSDGMALTLMWLAAALYLLFKLLAKVGRAVFHRGAGIAGAGGSKNTRAADVVEWVLPRASSSPSRADAMRQLPEYSARLVNG
jgi:hypothetical protein